MANHNDKEKLFCCHFWGGRCVLSKKRINGWIQLACPHTTGFVEDITCLDDSWNWPWYRKCKRKENTWVIYSTIYCSSFGSFHRSHICFIGLEVNTCVHHTHTYRAISCLFWSGLLSRCQEYSIPASFIISGPWQKALPQHLPALPQIPAQPSL